MKTQGIRIWAGQQRNGVVVEGRWQGAEPLWNIGVWVRSGDVQRGLKVSEVADTIKSALQAKFTSIPLDISPKAKKVLEGKHDGFSSFPGGQ